MAALGEHGFPVPRAIDSNRHAVLMSLVDAFPLVQVVAHALLLIMILPSLSDGRAEVSGLELHLAES